MPANRPNTNSIPKNGHSDGDMNWGDGFDSPIAGTAATSDNFYASGALPFGLVNNHAYMFEGLTTVSGTAYVQLGNPWGFAQPSLRRLPKRRKR